MHKRQQGRAWTIKFDLPQKQVIPMNEALEMSLWFLGISVMSAFITGYQFSRKIEDLQPQVPQTAEIRDFNQDGNPDLRLISKQGDTTYMFGVQEGDSLYFAKLDHLIETSRQSSQPGIDSLLSTYKISETP